MWPKRRRLFDCFALLCALSLLACGEGAPGGNGSNGNGSGGNGSTGNGTVGNGSTGNGGTGNGSTGNGSTGNGSVGNGEPVEGPTWYGDVLGLVQHNCMACHVDGGMAPMSLERYEDAVVWAGMMVDATESRRMPPWLPDDDCQPFHDTRRLSDDEIATFAAWLDAGTPEGDPADAPLPPTPPSLPQVDLDLEPAEAYVPNPGAGRDDYRCFILDPGLNRNIHITGADVIPAVGWMVHHVLLYPATRSAAEDKEASEAGPGWTCFGGPGVGSGLTLAGWAPGTLPTVYPEGTGIRLEQNEVIVMQVHYNIPDGRTPEPDRTRVLLMHDAPGDSIETAYMAPLMDQSFTIPPNSEGYESSNSITLPIAATAYGVFPHMHTLGRTIRVRATRLGEETCLLNVPDWDFHYQQFYFYDRDGGIRLPAGTTVEITCSWDNPTDDPITWGDRTEDEMCLNYIYTVP